MDIFDKIGVTLASAGKDVTQKAKDVSEVAKLKIDIRSKEEFVEKQYAALGKRYYEKYKDEKDHEEAEQFFLISEALEEIERMQAGVMKIQGAAKCPNCGAKVAETASFCSSCGAKIDVMFEE